jgi:flagellar hook-associated protein 3 FlgL
MRVSSKSFELQWLTGIYRRQAELARVQKQVTSGRRINTAADDPAGAAQMLGLQNGLGRLQEYAANAETARRRLALEENALDHLGNVLDRIRELTVQAGGANQAAEDRVAIANEVRELLASLVDIANTQDSEGRYLFSGNSVLTQPVTMVNGVATYNGNDGTRAQRISDNRTIQEGDAGSEVFFAIRNGNGTFSVTALPANQGTAYFSSSTLTNPAAWQVGDYAVTFTAADAYTVTDSGGNTIASGAWEPGEAVTFNGASIVIEGEPVAGDTFMVRQSVNRSVFATTTELITQLERDITTPRYRARLQNALNRTLLNLDQVQAHMSEVRSRVGARLATIEEQSSNNGELALQLEQTLSTVRDLDLPKAISELQTQMLGLEAAQKVFAQTRSLSLFDVL